MRSLPRIVSQIPNDLRNFLDRVREYLGEGGDSRFVTLRELKSGGIVGTTPNGTITPPTEFGVEEPNQPTGVTTTSGLASIFVEWDAPNYLGHLRTEVWGAATNDFSTKELLGTSPGLLYVDNIGGGGSRYYWVRFINLNEVAGPFSDINGVVGVASQDPAYLLDVLAGSITDAELSTALNTQIDTNTTQITNVRNLYTVKMDNQGYLTGFGLMSTLADGGVPTTDFFVNANRFAVTTPTTSIPTRANTTAYAVGAFVGVASSTSKMLVCKVAGTSGASAPNIASTAIGTLVTDGSVTWQVASRVPLSVLTTSATINGVSVSPGVYIDGASIVNATITNAAIGNAAITNAKIADLAADKITAGTLQVGSYIQSQSYVAGTSGWNINSDGTAEFAQAVVRGSIYGGAATAYGTGTGLFSGLDGATYKFRVGVPGGNQFTWDGTSLTVTGTISGGTILGGSATTYGSGTGFFAGLDSSVYKWRVGNPTGARIQWDGSAIYVYNASNQVTIASGDINYSVITGTKPPADATRNVVYRQATAPTSGMSVNDIWFNTSTQATYYYSGSAWVLAGDRTSSNTAAAITNQGIFATASQLTFGTASTYIAGLALNTPQFAYNSATDITSFTIPQTYLNVPPAGADNSASTTILTSMTLPSVDVATKRLIIINLLFHHADNSPGT